MKTHFKTICRVKSGRKFTWIDTTSEVDSLKKIGSLLAGEAKLFIVKILCYEPFYNFNFLKIFMWFWSIFQKFYLHTQQAETLIFYLRIHLRSHFCLLYCNWKIYLSWWEKSWECLKHLKLPIKNYVILAFHWSIETNKCLPLVN